MAVPPTPARDKDLGPRTSKDSQLNISLPNQPLADEIFNGRYRQKDYVDSFAEKHVKLAKRTSEDQLWAGKRLLEGVQG